MNTVWMKRFLEWKMEQINESTRISLRLTFSLPELTCSAWREYGYVPDPGRGYIPSAAISKSIMTCTETGRSGAPSTASYFFLSKGGWWQEFGAAFRMFFGTFTFHTSAPRVKLWLCFWFQLPGDVYPAWHQGTTWVVGSLTPTWEKCEFPTPSNWSSPSCWGHLGTGPVDEVSFYTFLN